MVPGAVAGGWFGLHALNSATEATSGTNAVAAATFRRAADLTMGRAYPGDDAGWNGPRRSGIISSSPATIRAGTARRGAGCSYLERYGALDILSEPTGIIECMFDESSAVLVERIAAAARAENQAAGQRLAVIGELDVMRLREVGERETWCTDTQEAVTAEVAAALIITQALAASYLYYSRTMRLRLPRVGALLRAGHIDYRMLSQQ